MIVGVCGYGYSGSGAVFDYIREFDEVDSINNIEFNITYLPHGIRDLELHLIHNVSRFYSSDAAIKDFLNLIYSINSPNSIYRKRLGNDFLDLSIEFIKNITQLSWNGWWAYDALASGSLYRTFRFRLMTRLIHCLEAITQRHIKIFPKEQIYFSVNPTTFLEEAQRYLNKIIIRFGCDMNKLILLDQPFEANAPFQSMKYYKNSKAIVVDRDPRDIYILAKKVLLDKAAFIPTDNVYKFINYYRLCRSDRHISTPNVLFVLFEDMIYQYEYTTTKINKFLNIYTNHTKQYQYFNPQISINNTQLYLKYLELKKDISIIEQELPEYLYPFEKYNLKPNAIVSF